MFALADCNNFFVSCERVFRPDLVGKPVVVLSNNDGCAISRSNEAKLLGIKMGQPMYQFKDLISEGKVTVFSSNFLLYGDMSQRVRHILRSSAPSIEIYSIDECFLDLSGMENTDFDRWAKTLSADSLRNTGIPISVGVAPTKTLSKIASKLCKQYPKLQGGCYLHRPDDIEKVLRNFPIEDIWGIGRRYAGRFKYYFGLATAYDFFIKDESWVRNEMGITGVYTWRELHSEPCIALEKFPTPKKQILFSRSFAKEIADFEELSQQVSMFCSKAVEKLRKQHSACYAATVFVCTNRHKDNEPRQYEGKLVTFPVATESTLEINHAVMTALKSIFRQGMKYKRAGVCLSEIVSADNVQLSMFDNIDHKKHSILMTAVDNINKKEGRTAVSVASQSLDGIKMNREHLSPQYTTDWNDIMTVYCR